MKNLVNYLKEPYWCNKCKKFHNPSFKNKTSITHLEHFCYFSRYKKDFSQSELLKIGIKKSWKQNIKKEKDKPKTKLPLFIN